MAGAPSQMGRSPEFVFEVAWMGEIPPEGLVRGQAVRPTVLIGGSASDCVDRRGAQDT